MEQSDRQESDDPELKALRERFFINYGRLLWRYQQIEAAAKLLGANLDIKVTTTPSGPVVSDGKEEFDGRPLGKIQKPLTIRLFATEEADQPVPDETSARFVFRPYDGIGAEEKRRFEAEYSTLVDNRNELVHHFTDRVKLGDRASIEAGIALIVQRLEAALPLHQRLVDLLREMGHARAVMGELLRNPLIERAIKTPPGQGLWNINAVLEAAARESSHAGGWVLLSDAGRRLHQEAGMEMDDFKTVTGHKTLKEFLKAWPQFEFHEEVRPSGAIQLRYRLAG